MSIKNSILFGLTLIDVVLREFHDPAGFLSFSYKNLYGFVPQSYRRKNLYSIIHSLKNKGSIESVEKGRFRFSRNGKEDFSSTYPVLKFIDKPWDGKWRLLGFDIEEQRRSLRTALRQWLRRSGFGMLQKSLYVSPLPVEQDVALFLSSHRDIFQNTYVFVSDTFFTENRQVFLDKIFHLNEISKAYKSLLYRIKGASAPQDREQFLRDFLEISRRDPFLPKELLPKGFMRPVVWKLFIKEGIFGF